MVAWTRERSDKTRCLVTDTTNSIPALLIGSISAFAVLFSATKSFFLPTRLQKCKHKPATPGLLFKYADKRTIKGNYFTELISNRLSGWRDWISGRRRNILGQNWNYRVPESKRRVALVPEFGSDRFNDWEIEHAERRTHMTSLHSPFIVCIQAGKNT